MTVYAHWLKGENIQNFGDFLTDYFLSKMFTPDETKESKATVHLVGSVLSDWQVTEDKRLFPTDVARVFWGVGAREESSLEQILSDLSNFVLSVRGPATALQLGVPDGLVYGDPALLLPLVFNPHPTGTRIKNLLIPHFLDTRSDAFLLEITGADEVLRPNIPPNLAAIERFLSRLCSAERVLCGALHGAIVAEAYGVEYLYWDSGKIDVPFKWEDFSQSVGRKTPFIKSFYDWPDATTQTQKRISKLALSLSAPRLVRPEILELALAQDLQDIGTDGLVLQLTRLAQGNLRILAHAIRLVAERDGLVAERHAVIRSLSWRWTAPLRQAKRVCSFFNRI